MSMRDEARKMGGEEAVAVVDASQKMQRELFAKLSEITEAAVEGKEGLEEQIALVSLCEALSASFANVVAVTAKKCLGKDRAGAVQMAIKSVASNINEAFDTLVEINSMSSEQVADLIGEAVAKRGPLPKAGKPSSKKGSK